MLLALATPAAAAGPSAQVGVVQAAAALGPLGEEAIRFTALQPDGRSATIYQAERGEKGLTRTLIDLSAAPGGGWAVNARETKPLAGETFDYFRGLIDTAAGGTATPTDCTAGPEYRAEHGSRVAAGCGTEGAVPAIARALGLAEPLTP